MKKAFVIAEFDSTNLPTKYFARPVGIDFGIRTYLTLSDGRTFQCPHFFTQNLGHYERCNLMGYILDKQHKWHEEIARDLCNRYDAIFLETLDLDEIGRKYRKKMIDCDHEQFLGVLYKMAEEKNVIVHKVHKYYASSKTCTCGHVYRGKYSHYWTCPKCKATHERDSLAARNILHQGILDLKKKGYTYLFENCEIL